MKIHFERTGGFMGLRMVATIDIDDLPEEQAETLLSLLDEVDFYELPARLDSPDPAMDQFHYVLSVIREAPPKTRSFLPPFDDEDDDSQGFISHAFHNHDFRDRDSRDRDLRNSEFSDRDSSDRYFREAEPSPAGEEETHTVTFTDAAAPPEMQPLIRMLTRMAHGQ